MSPKVGKSSMTQQEEGRAKFKQLLEPWINTYDSICVTYLALMSSKGPVICHFEQTLLGPSNVGFGGTVFKHISKSLMCGCFKKAFSARALEEFLDRLQEGQIDIDGTMALFENNGSQTRIDVRDGRHYLATREDRSILVDISGGDIGYVKRDLDHEALNWEVRSTRPPYDDTGELLRLMGVRRDLLSSGITSPIASIIALPPGLVGDESNVKDGKARFVIRASRKADRRKFSITYKLVSKTGIDRSGDIRSGFSWTSDDKGESGLIEVETGDAAEVHVFLHYGDQAVHHTWLRDLHKYLNPKLAIYKTYDSDLEALSKLLFQPKGNAFGFEIGVALLLTALGLSTSHHGAQKKIQDGPDIVAQSPDGRVIYVVECTTDVLDKNDKLGKLVSRTRALEESLALSKLDFMEVVPVIVSALGKGRLQAHIDSAGDNRVAVISKETLEGWLLRIDQPVDSAWLYREILGLIPPRSNPSISDML